MHQYRVELGGFLPWMWYDSTDLKASHRSYFQQPDHWSLFFLEHDGIVSINNKPYEYKVGNVCFVTPGTKVQFLYTGSGTLAYSFTFGLTARNETVAIPAVADLGKFTELRRKDVVEAVEWARTSIMRALAWSFNVLWSVAKPASELRKSELVSHAEAYIIHNLGSSISIGRMCAEIGSSHNHLLRLFQDQHQCTIQQYIREIRAEIGKQMITDTELSIKEIATKVGCQDLQYFNKLIRRYSGFSPLKLRENAQSRARH